MKEICGRCKRLYLNERNQRICEVDGRRKALSKRCVNKGSYEKSDVKGKNLRNLRKERLKKRRKIDKEKERAFAPVPAESVPVIKEPEKEKERAFAPVPAKSTPVIKEPKVEEVKEPVKASVVHEGIPAEKPRVPEEKPETSKKKVERKVRDSSRSAGKAKKTGKSVKKKSTSKKKKKSTKKTKKK